MTQFLDENRHLPFDWNGWSCALMALLHADTITGTNHYDDFRLHCTDEQTSMDYLQSLGGMEAVATSLFGEPIDTPKKAQRGDIMMVENEGIETIGVVHLTGRHLVLLNEQRGMITVPLENLDKKLAWRI